MLPVMVNKDVY